ncbi:MAG TPA: thioredoxin domain-containing protein [Acidimicrobiia bacterium]
MNRLAQSTSPYLLQHAENPVEWHEWGEEAFGEAKHRDVPVLLSVGYSACHWCHVMAHESFEDDQTAQEMNASFVNIKVDREERPDVDAVYMEAVQAMTGQGGWPMTVWLTPEGVPFYAGTYFPKDDRGGMPSFRRVIRAISEAWSENREEVEAQAHRIGQALSTELSAQENLAAPSDVEAAFKSIASTFDGAFGGFGGAPKFPQQPLLEFLLRLSATNSDAGEMLAATLTAMSKGGIYDQLGGGFARYSVDRSWIVPHFEKMLYDNAQLVRLYLWAGIEFDRSDLIDIAQETIAYLLRDLRHPDGGFFSAEDADSEGVEGKFYVWSLDEVEEVCGDDAPTAIEAWGVTRAGNFEGENILVRSPSWSPSPALERCQRAMLERRSQRTRPGLDDKVLAGWNGLAIRALAEAGAALDKPDLLQAARQAADFVLSHLVRNDGRRDLLRTWAKGKPGQTPGFLEDYSAMGIGLLTLYAATGEVQWFREAEWIIRQIPERFAGDRGAMFTSESDELIKRPRDLFDNPLPSGNSLAAEAMLMLALYTGDAELRDRAEANLAAVAPVVSRYPSGVGHALALTASIHSGTRELAIVGSDRGPMVDVFWSQYRPDIVLAQSDTASDEVPLLLERQGEPGGLAYLCSGMVCLAPTNSPAALRSLLDNT